MYSRLRKNHKMEKTASIYQTFNHFTLKSGDSISFQIKLLANRPWFQIIHDYEFSNSSYYDGPDLERACDIYIELLIAFKGALRAEEFRRSIPFLKEKIEKLIEEKNQMAHDDMYNNLKRQPLFLGINNF